MKKLSLLVFIIFVLPLVLYAPGAGGGSGVLVQTPVAVEELVVQGVQVASPVRAVKSTMPFTSFANLSRIPLQSA